MSRIWKSIVSGLFVCFAAAPVLAVAQEQDVEGSKDHPLISRYPGSVIVSYNQREFDEYDLPVGATGPDKVLKTQHLEGKLTIIGYSYSKQRSTLEVLRNYQSALQRAGFQELYKCIENECGSGDPWPGPGDPKHLGQWRGWHNRYLSAKLARPEGDVWVGLNIYEMGPTLHLAVVELKPMESGLVTVDAASLAGDITRTGHASVYGIYFDTGKADVKPESDAALKEIAKLLQQDANLKLYVVGHTDNQGGLEMNMDLSRRRGDAVVKVLTAKYGVAAERLRAAGDGPTAPVASNDTEEGRAKNRRVELVKQ